VGKHEAKKPLSRLGSKWEDNIKKNFKEIGSAAGIGFIWFSTRKTEKSFGHEKKISDFTECCKNCRAAGQLFGYQQGFSSF
jgi:hypothetical protein